MKPFAGGMKKKKVFLVGTLPYRSFLNDSGDDDWIKSQLIDSVMNVLHCVGLQKWKVRSQGHVEWSSVELSDSSGNFDTVENNELTPGLYLLVRYIYLFQKLY